MALISTRLCLLARQHACLITLMRFRRFQFALPLLPVLTLLAGFSMAAHAVSCTVSAAMPASDRAALAQFVSSIGEDVARGDANTLKAAAAPGLANNFADIASTVGGLAPGLKGAAITVENLYTLHARDLKGAGDDAQFFCSRPSSPLLVTVTLGQIPPGEYALAIVHATGVAAPQQFALILENTGAAGAPAQWQLAGFFVRPLTVAGHSGIWFWDQARALKSKNAPLSAYLYYQEAAQLARPADVYTSGNLDRLSQESDAVKPKDMPGDAPMLLHGQDGSTFSVTGMNIDTGLGAMDLRVDATVPTLGDPVASRKSALALMSALLGKYPGLRDSFHGLWVFEKAANGQTYAIEQPMTALE